MSESIAAIAASALTGFVALLTVHLTNRGNNARFVAQLAHEKDKSRVELLRQKGEELYELSAEWQQNFSVQCISILAAMKGELSYNDALDLHNKGVEPGKHHRLQLLVQAYFPQLQAELDAVKARIDVVSKLRSLHKMKYKQGETDGDEFVEPFTAANLALVDAIEALKAATASIVRATASAARS